ncbi:hypothetical protein [Herbaspirillum sp. ST 5-3]|uniref:hypothetical protein n=1 Tax=Oxalobacteraceae TaxID=75682 RepID=UPI0010A2FBBA|nr:hypothetical protein [Herbaspirillum sp. ST 5-3]
MKLENAKQIEEIIHSKLNESINHIGNDQAIQLSKGVKDELEKVFGASVVNELFGSRGLNSLPELSQLATSSMKMKALYIAEIMLINELMNDALVKNKKLIQGVENDFSYAVKNVCSDIDENFKSESLEAKNKTLAKHDEVIQLLESVLNQAKRVSVQGNEIRNKGDNSITKETKEFEEKTHKILRSICELNFSDFRKKAYYNEFENKKIVVNKLHNFAYFLLGGSVVMCGLCFMKLFS